MSHVLLRVDAHGDTEMCWLPRRNHQCYYQPSQSLLQWRAVYCATTQQLTIPPRHHQPRHSTNPVAMFWLMCLARGKDHGAPEPHVADGRHMSTRLRQFKVWFCTGYGTKYGTKYNPNMTSDRHRMSTRQKPPLSAHSKPPLSRLSSSLGHLTLPH